MTRPAHQQDGGREVAFALLGRQCRWARRGSTSSLEIIADRATASTMTMAVAAEKPPRNHQQGQDRARRP